MGQFIDQQESGLSLEGGLKVELLELGPTILHDPVRQYIQAQQQRFGFGANVLLCVAHQHVHSFSGLVATFLQHGVGLANPGRCAKEHLELAALGRGFLLLHLSQQRIRIGAMIG